MQTVRLRWTDLWIFLGWLVLGIFVLPVDVPISRWLVNGGLPGDVRGIFRRGEAFGHAYGMAAVAITIYVLDPARRRCLPHLVGTFLAAGLTADLVKLQAWRMRPRAFLESGLENSFVGSPWLGDKLGWSQVVDHTIQSFPSAHTAGAVALAYRLAELYPAGRTWFYVLAVLCAANRVDGGAHFASDVCWGVALGYVVARLVPSPVSKGARETTPEPAIPRRTEQLAA